MCPSKTVLIDRPGAAVAKNLSGSGSGQFIGNQVIHRPIADGN
jgi:hypothetical protein